LFCPLPLCGILTSSACGNCFRTSSAVHENGTLDKKIVRSGFSEFAPESDGAEGPDFGPCFAGKEGKTKPSASF
jgi:hypothetical protein